MKTLKSFADAVPSIPTVTAWSLTELAEMKGHQDLFTKQSPQKLEALREHAIIESSVASNRMEGVEIDQERIRAVVLGKGHLRDRNEQEVRQYQEALRWIHENAAEIPLSVSTIKRLHRISRKGIWDAGKLKEKDGDIIETYPDGTSRVRFRTVPAKETPGALGELFELYEELAKDQRVPSLILLAAFNLDFLCIHPFRDGNGRVSRLLLLLQLYHFGYEAGRYVSIERTIEQNKERYYETLEQSSTGWHKGKHEPWGYANYLLFVLKSVYQEFEDRIGQVAAPRGEKTDIVMRAIERFLGAFRVAEVQRECPGVSIDMIRRVLKDLRTANKVECLGRGKNAKWRKLGELGNR